MIATAAIILAAGASTRLGEPKQLAMLAGERLLERAIRTASEAGCDPIVVVLGYEAERIAAECDLGEASGGMVVGVVVNEAWREGMASSIRAGIRALQPAVDAALVMTCDQPAVTPAHLACIAAAATGHPVASSYAGRKGVPACFPAASFDGLLALEGDMGARRLLASAEAVELAGGELDIDTPEALRLAKRLYESRG